MRLVRLTSPKTQDKTTSEWENYFNEDLILKPKSKIGLLNISIPINRKTIVIDGTNDEFTFKVKKSQNLPYLVKIPHNSYTADEFLSLITKLANAQLVTRGIVQGSEVGFILYFSSISQADGDHVEMSFMRNIADDFKDYPANAKVQINGNILTRTVVAGNDENQAFLMSKLPFLMSSGIYYTTVLAVRDMVLGLSSNYDGSASMGDNNMDFLLAIGDPNNTGSRTYYFKNSDGTLNISNILPAVDDIISIEVNKGSLDFYYRRQNVANLLGTVACDTMNRYSPVVGLRESGSSCNLPRIIYDGRFVTDGTRVIYQPQKTSIIEYVEYVPTDGNLGLPPQPAPNPANSSCIVNFTSDIDSILGFNGKIYSFMGASNTWTSSYFLNELILPKNLLVELQNIPLNTMDGGLGKRRNIVAIIPQMNVNEDFLIYECQSNPIMLDINNAFDINLRSLRVRILQRSDENDLLIDLYDRIELTILLD